MIALDGSTSLWVIGLLCFLLGSVIGCILAYSVVGRKNRTQQLQMELNELANDFRDYRDQVTHHFMRTSELVQEMTLSYRSVYEHLATGAQHLCGENEAAAIRQTGATQVTASDNHEATATPGNEYDELEELAKIRNDIDELLGDAPHISDLDIKAENKTDNPVQH